MTLSSSKDAVRRFSDSKHYFSPFPSSGQLESREQIRRFELLRLAFFALKLRKLDAHLVGEPVGGVPGAGPNDASLEVKGHGKELEFRRSLLRHVIFQQVLTLIQLDAREQALQIIAACRN